MSDYLVRFELSSGCSIDVRVDGNKKILPHFKLYELANTKGKTTIPQFVINEEIMKFLNCVEKYRNYYYKKYGTGINVNSCYRQVNFNRSCGGDKNSLHLVPFAIDIQLCKAAKTEANRKADEMEWKTITMSDGLFGGCNWYSNGAHLSVHEERFGNENFVHRDYRNQKGDW